MMEYKGYHGKAELDDEAGIFHGRVLGLRDVVTFEGTTVKLLEKSFRDSVDEYLAFCQERGRSPEKPLSGKFQARVGEELHRDLVIAAEEEDTSLNDLMVRFLRSCLDRRHRSNSSREKTMASM